MIFSDKKKARMDRIINPLTKRALLVAFDHGAEHGPAAYDGISLDPLRVAKIAYVGGESLILHAGAARYVRQYFRQMPLIIKLTAKTSLTPKNMQSIVTTPKEAEALDAVAVACTVYVGSEYEGEMLENLSEIKKQCMERKMPLVGFMYPRVRRKKKDSVNLVRYAARLGAEIGVDVVKTYYTGSMETFSRVVKDAGFVSVVSGGGKKKENEFEFYKMVKDVMEAGAAGMAVGRNLWGREKPLEALKEIRKIIYGETI